METLYPSNRNELTYHSVLDEGLDEEDNDFKMYNQQHQDY